MRLNPERPVAPLVEAAAKYVGAETRYDIPVLAILADIDMRNITKLARKFLALVEEILEKTSSDLPLDALFVAPSDLAY